VPLQASGDKVPLPARAPRLRRRPEGGGTPAPQVGPFWTPVGMVPPTGRRCANPATGVYRVADGRVADGRVGGGLAADPPAARGGGGLPRPHGHRRTVPALSPPPGAPKLPARQPCGGASVSLLLHRESIHKRRVVRRPSTAPSDGRLRGKGPWPRPTLVPWHGRRSRREGPSTERRSGVAPGGGRWYGAVRSCPRSSGRGPEGDAR
jgi:hypothetical protein